MRKQSPARSLALLSLVSGPLVLAGCGAPGAGDPGATASAQAVYASYQAGAHDRVQFVVSELERGPLTAIAGRTVNDLLGVPDYWLHMEQRGTEITAVARTPRDPSSDEWRQPIQLGRFEELGRPLAEGTYALLGVHVALDGVDSEHRALEVCWPAQGFCTIMDPVVNQLSAFAANRARLLAEGWAVKVAEEGLKPGERGTQTTICSLNSNPAATRRSLTWGAYTLDYKDIFGITLVHKYMGGQQVGVACYVSGTSCFSSGFGYSNASSCYGNLGYNCDCDNTGNQDGSTQPSTRSWSETRCSHQLVLNANVSWTIQGVGSGFNISWTTSGSVDANGGQLYDACSYH